MSGVCVVGEEGEERLRDRSSMRCVALQERHARGTVENGIHGITAEQGLHS